MTANERECVRVWDCLTMPQASREASASPRQNLQGSPTGPQTMDYGSFCRPMDYSPVHRPKDHGLGVQLPADSAERGGRYG